jgi:hypothetical protein
MQKQVKHSCLATPEQARVPVLLKAEKDVILSDSEESNIPKAYKLRFFASLRMTDIRSGVGKQSKK